MRELRHDFRAYYGCAYDDVPADEAVDLALTLPRGSLYVASVAPERAWTDEMELSADVRDTIVACAYALRGLGDPPTVTRPRDVVARSRDAERAREVRRRIEGSSWEPVEGG